MTILCHTCTPDPLTLDRTALAAGYFRYRFRTTIPVKVSRIQRGVYLKYAGCTGHASVFKNDSASRISTFQIVTLTFRDLTSIHSTELLAPGNVPNTFLPQSEVLIPCKLSMTTNTVSASNLDRPIAGSTSPDLKLGEVRAGQSSFSVEVRILLKLQSNDIVSLPRGITFHFELDDE